MRNLPTPSRSVFLSVALSALLLGAAVPLGGASSRPAVATAGAATVWTAHRAALLSAYGRLPQRFERNVGQSDGRVQFLARGAGYTLFLTGSGEAVLALSSPRQHSAAESHLGLRTPPSTRTTVLRLRFAGANAHASVQGLDRLSGISNYLIGRDRRQWQRHVLAYARVMYRHIYPGVDLVYYGTNGHLEYDLLVAPGADPRAIRLDVIGAGTLRLNAQGNVVLSTGAGALVQQRPRVYQMVGGHRRAVAGRYVLLGAHRLGFAIGAHDSRAPLVIDPNLIYSTYLGGNGADYGHAIAVDSQGYAYVTGYTASTDFPVINARQIHFAGGTSDAFVTKLNPSGTAYVYSTYLGGTATDQGYGIAADSKGNAYVTGSTNSLDFPIYKQDQGSFAGGASDAFVTVLSADGSTLLYSTYLGGRGDDAGYGIAVDSVGNAYVTGGTTSTDFRTVSPYQSKNAGGYDAFLTKFNQGGAIVYSTYLGGSSTDEAYAVAVNGYGDAYVAGQTYSANFPISTTIQQSPGSSGDAFVTEFTVAGNALVYSTYLGGNGLDGANGIALDNQGNVYVTGFTTSTNFPAVNAYQPTCGDPSCAGGDAFVTKIGRAGDALVYSTYLGGSHTDLGNAIAVDSQGDAYVVGETNSANFPVVNAIEPKYIAPYNDGFISELSMTGSMTTTALTFSTYLAGGGDNYAYGVAVDSQGNIYVTGSTSSPDFPTANPIQGNNEGGFDAFVTALGKPGITFTPPSLNFGDQPEYTFSSAQNITVTNSGAAPLTISSIVVTGTDPADFLETDTCTNGGLILRDHSCLISVLFKPSALGPLSATLAVSDNVVGSPQYVPLSGVGIVNLTPTVTPSPTNTPTNTPTRTPTPLPTNTPTNTPTPLPTNTAVTPPTNTPVTPPTNTPVTPPTNTPPPSPTDTATNTPLPSPTDTATNTPVPTDTATNTPLPPPTDTATNTPLPTNTAVTPPTNTPVTPPTNTPVTAPSNTPGPTNTATTTPLASSTATTTPPTNTPVTAGKKPKPKPKPKVPQCRVRKGTPSLTISLPRGRIKTGSTLTVRLHTAARAHADVTLQVVTIKTTVTGKGKHRKKVKHTIVLYRVTIKGTADKKGSYSGRIRITYKPSKTATATLTAGAKSGCNSSTRSLHVTIWRK